MKRGGLWLAKIGFAGICAVVSGCGGGDDVPDPSSDALAASDTPPPAPAFAAPAPAPTATPAPAARPEPGAAPAATPKQEPVAAKPTATPKAEDVPPEETAQNQEAEKPKPDTSSTTAEMLTLATTPAAPSPGGGSAGGSSTPAASGGPAGRGGPGNSGGPPGMGGPAGPGGRPNMGLAGPGGPPPNAVPRDPGAMADAMRGQMPAMAMNNARPGMPGAMAGMPGGRGNGGRPGADKPADFRTPEGAVDAFLNALDAKDLTRLAEATALRAQEEASPKKRDLFRRIYDESLSESELADLAKTLDGFKIIGENPQKSTGRVEVIISKSTQSARLTHKVTTRKEKKGWGVLDIGPEIVFKNPRTYGGNQQGGAGGGAR